MEARSSKDRRSAVTAALRCVRDELQTRRSVCVQVYASVRQISVFEVKRGRKEVVARFRWEEPE